MSNDGSARTYRYKEVETALARLHVGEQALGAFRGRLVHFQKIGITPASPGRGKKIEYSFEDVAVWAFCLQLAEFGIDPSRIASIKQFYWEQVAPHLLQEQSEEQMFALFPRMLTQDLIDKVEEPKSKGAGTLPLHGGDNGMRVVFEASELDLRGCGRALVINLALLRKRLIAAIAS